mmetsp:Transcript_20646/g.33295  ORF Transcript_20646/g.33295 Transcript_20646/m.33295 type:complete len:141 (-) Transcript_20646:555-977(-)
MVTSAPRMVKTTLRNRNFSLLLKYMRNEYVVAVEAIDNRPQIRFLAITQKFFWLFLESRNTLQRKYTKRLKQEMEHRTSVAAKNPNTATGIVDPQTLWPSNELIQAFPFAAEANAEITPTGRKNACKYHQRILRKSLVWL